MLSLPRGLTPVLGGWRHAFRARHIIARPRAFLNSRHKGQIDIIHYTCLGEGILPRGRMACLLPTAAIFPFSRATRTNPPLRLKSLHVRGCQRAVLDFLPAAMRFVLYKVATCFFFFFYSAQDREGCLQQLIILTVKLLYTLGKFSVLCGFPSLSAKINSVLL